MTDTITPEQFAAAQTGQSPPTGKTLSDRELGERLAPHRRGRYTGQPFRKQTIQLYRTQPHKQSADFIEAYRSWYAAETLRQSELNVRFCNGMTIDEMVAEAGHIIQLGADPPRLLLLIGELPPDTLISVNGTAKTILNRAGTRQCACGQRFVVRSWNHRRCRPDCTEANKKKTE